MSESTRATQRRCAYRLLIGLSSVYRPRYIPVKEPCFLCVAGRAAAAMSAQGQAAPRMLISRAGDGMRPCHNTIIPRRETMWYRRSLAMPPRRRQPLSRTRWKSWSSAQTYVTLPAVRMSLRCLNRAFLKPATPNNRGAVRCQVPIYQQAVCMVQVAAWTHGLAFIQQPLSKT